MKRTERMSSDLDAAVARLKRDLDAIAAETSGAKEARGDVRLLLADWERLREMTSPAAGLARLEQELGIMDKTIAERDAARAEVERLKAELTSEREQWAGFVDACAQVGVTWTMRDPTPEHPIGVEIRNAAVTELARLRERDARVRAVLGNPGIDRQTAITPRVRSAARCAELEREARNLYDFARGVVDGDVLRRNHQHDFWLEQRDRLKVVLASDGTSALAAVRLAQRLAKMVTPPKERPADLGLNRREKLALEVEAALTEAFGSGE